jgi:hypothetical protein
MWAMRIQAHGAFGGCFEVLGEPAAPAEPREGSFDHPPAGQKLEALCGVGALDDLKAPLAELGHGVAQLGAGITAIGENVTQSWVERTHRCQQAWRAIAILDVDEVTCKPTRWPSVSVTM